MIERIVERMNDHQSIESVPPPESVRQNLLTITYVIYGLHAISAMAGLLTPAFVLTAFVSGWPSILAVILNYVKRNEVRGTYLESHFRWQIRTFWFALLWVLITLVLVATWIGIPLAIGVAWVAGLWVMYRIVRGGLRLMDARPMPF